MSRPLIRKAQGPAPGPDRPRKPYTKPTMRVERLIGKTSLACVKTFGESIPCDETPTNS